MWCLMSLFPHANGYAVMKNPADLTKYQANPKVAPIIAKMMSKFSGAQWETQQQLPWIPWRSVSTGEQEYGFLAALLMNLLLFPDSLSVITSCQDFYFINGIINKLWVDPVCFLQ